MTSGGDIGRSLDQMNVVPESSWWDTAFVRCFEVTQ